MILVELLTPAFIFLHNLISVDSSKNHVPHRSNASVQSSCDARITTVDAAVLIRGLLAIPEVQDYFVPLVSVGLAVN